jgi:arabinose-5-phosphate isomerase
MSKDNLTVKALVKEQSRLIQKAIDSFDSITMDHLASDIACCKGIIVLTGVGKSAYIAQKVAMTFVSCGTKAVFLSPTDALHGDIGIVNKDDWVIMLSRSGESDELVELIPYLKKREVKIAVVVGERNSRIASLANHIIHIPFEQELGPLPMIPTTSAALQMIFCDVLALAVASLKGISQEDFARNHPAGQIGKRLHLKVHDLMLKENELPLAHACQHVEEILVELSNKRSGCLVVISENGKLEGIFTDGDLRRSLQKFGRQVLDEPLHKVMTNHPQWIDAEKLAYEALQLMEADSQKLITSLPVLDRGVVVGLIRMHDLLQAGL